MEAENRCLFPSVCVYCTGLDNCEGMQTENCKPALVSHWVTCFCGGSTKLPGLFLLIMGRDTRLTNEPWVNQPTRDGSSPCQDCGGPLGFPPARGADGWTLTQMGLRSWGERDPSPVLFSVQGGRATCWITVENNKKNLLVFIDFPQVLNVKCLTGDLIEL